MARRGPKKTRAKAKNAPNVRARGRSSPPESKPDRTAETPPLALRLLELCVIAQMVVIPLVLIPGLRDPFRLPKQLLAELLALVSIACLLAVPRERLAGMLERCRSAAIAIGPLWLVATISVALSERSGLAMAGLWSFSIGAAALIAWSAGLLRPARIVSWLMLPAGLVAFLALLEAADWFDPISAVAASSRLELTATVGNPGDLSVFLLLPVLFAQMRVARELGLGGAERSSSDSSSRKPSRSLLLWGGLALMMIAAVLLTQTLAALLALGAGTAVLWGLVVASSDLGSATKRRVLASGVLVAVVLGVGVASVGPLRERVVAKVAQVTKGDLNSALTGRLDGWRAAVWMMESRPVVGIGLGTYGATYTTAKEALMADGTPFFAHHGPFSSFANAHSEIFEVAAELGTAGVLCLGWGVWVLIGRLRNRWHSGSPRTESGGLSGRCETAFLVAGCVAIAVDAVFYFPMRAALTAYPVVLVLAWALAEDEADAGISAQDAPGQIDSAVTT